MADFDWRRQAMEQESIVKMRTLQQIRDTIDDAQLTSEQKLVLIDRLLRVAGYDELDARARAEARQP